MNRIAIDGKAIVVSSFMLSTNNDKWQIHMKVLCEGNSYNCIFSNISSLKLNMDMNDLIIEGFQIIDNSSRGWERGNRYLVNDYESDTISFYCEDIEVTQQ